MDITSNQSCNRNNIISEIHIILFSCNFLKTENK